MKLKAENMFLRLHTEERNCYDVEEVDDVVLRDSAPNDCGVLMERVKFCLLDSKTDYVLAEIAKYKSLYYAGYEFGYHNGGGCAGPSIHGTGFASIKEAMLNIIEKPFLNKRWPELGQLKRVINGFNPVQLEILW